MTAGSGKKKGESLKELSRREILEKKDFTLEPVDVPEWDGVVHVRTMTGEERDAFEDEMLQRQDENGLPKAVAGLKVKFVALTACDAEGKRLFGGDGDEARLAKKSAAAIDRLFAVAKRLSHLTDEAVEELAEGFTEGRSDSSGSS